MAKLALIFVIFALFAVCMAARIPRDEPTTPNPIEAIFNELSAKIQAAVTPEKQEEYKKLIQDAAKEGLASFQKLSQQVNQQIQSVNADKP